MKRKRVSEVDDLDLELPEINPFNSLKELEEFILGEFNEFRKAMRDRISDFKQLYKLYVDIVKDCKKEKKIPPANITEALTSVASKMASMETNYAKFLVELDRRKNILKSLEQPTEANQVINIIGFGNELPIEEPALTPEIIEALETFKEV